MTLNDALKKCQHGSTLLDPKSDQEVKFFKSIVSNEDFWLSSDIDSVGLKNVFCQFYVSGRLNIQLKIRKI